MSLVPIPGRPGPTRFDDWAWDAILVSGKFYRLSENCRDQWLVGPLLSDGFMSLSNLFSSIAGYGWTLDNAIRTKWAWIVGLTEGTTFREILDYFSYHYRSIRDDPVGWVKWRFANISPDMRDFIFNTYGWLSNRLTAQVWWYSTFREFPWDWVRDRLQDYRFWTRNFFDNPLVAVRDWMYQNVPALSSINTSPISWIIIKLNTWYPWFGSYLANPRLYICDFINSYVGWFWDFLNDPRTFINSYLDSISYELQRFIDDSVGYFREKLALIIGFSVADTYSFPIALFRETLDKIVGNKAIFEQRIQDTFIEIILWFI